MLYLAVFLGVWAYVGRARADIAPTWWPWLPVAVLVTLGTLVAVRFVATLLSLNGDVSYASQALQDEIDVAKEDLGERGFKFD